MWQTQLINLYAETNLFLGEEYISQEASYTARQSYTRVNLHKPVNEKLFLLDSQKLWFLPHKTQNLCLKKI